MSGAQGGLIPKGTGSEILTPGQERQVAVHRDEAAPGAGSYFGKLSDGTEEPIGGPGSASGIPFANDTNAAANVVQVTFPGFVALVDDYTFEVRILTTNSGATQLQIAATGLKDVVDQNQDPLVAGMLETVSIYLFAYNLTLDKYQLLGLARDNGVNGTLNKVAKFTPDGKHVGDSQRTDDGTDVTDDVAGEYTKNVLGTDDNAFVNEDQNHNYEAIGDEFAVQYGTFKETLVGATVSSKTFAFAQGGTLNLEIAALQAGAATGILLFSTRKIFDGLTPNVSESGLMLNTLNIGISVTDTPVAGGYTSKYDVTGEAGQTQTVVWKWSYISF